MLCTLNLFSESRPQGFWRVGADFATPYSILISDGAPRYETDVLRNHSDNAPLSYLLSFVHQGLLLSRTASVRFLQRTSPVHNRWIRDPGTSRSSIWAEPLIVSLTSLATSFDFSSCMSNFQRTCANPPAAAASLCLLFTSAASYSLASSSIDLPYYSLLWTLRFGRYDWRARTISALLSLAGQLQSQQKDPLIQYRQSSLLAKPQIPLILISLGPPLPL